MSKRIKAFTILELLVALAISGIVISIAGVAYSLTTKQFNEYRTASNTISKAFSLDARIKTDFFNSTHISKNESGIDIERRHRSGVSYIFNEQFILRTENARTDTFRISPSDIRFLFKDEPVQEGTIDEMGFDAIVLDEPETFSYSRSYGAEKVMNEPRSEDKWR